MNKFLRFAVVFVAFFILPASSGWTLELVQKGKPLAVIAIGKDATKAEEYAANELQKYIQKISQAKLRVTREDEALSSSEKTIILIGTPSSTKFMQQKELDLSQIKYDGFLIEEIPYQNKNYLVFASRESIGCIYAVYDFLEKELGVGFFWNQERIPQNETIAVGEKLNIQNSPYFEHREYYSGWGRWEKFWTFEEWKEEIGWMLKHKFNVFYTGMVELLPKTTLDKLVYQKMGVDLGEITSVDKYKLELSKKVVNHARGLGIKYTEYSFSGWVPAQFKVVYPDAHYFGIKGDTASSSIYLYPTDPLFQKIGKAFLEEYKTIYGGTDHLYNIDIYAELEPDLSPEETNLVKTDFAKAVCRYIKESDPEGIWLLYAWTWSYRFSRFWSEEEVEKFLNAIPQDMLIVIDPMATNSPTHKFLDYYGGKKWGFGVLHSMMGWSHLHGQIRGLITDYRKIVDEPQAKNCVASYLSSEITNDNPLFYELAADLAWNPKEVALDSFLKDYARLRYGKKMAPQMERVLNLLVDCVYNDRSMEVESTVRPLYWNLKDVQYLNSNSGPFAERFSSLGRLREAVKIMSEVSDEVPKDDYLFLNDFLDVTKQYVGDLFNYHFWNLKDAFARKDSEKFEKNAVMLQKLLDFQEKLLSCWPRYQIKTMIEEVSREFPDKSDAIRQIKGSYIIDFSHQANQWFEALRDYAGRDLYELLRDYYNPRFKIYVSHLRECLKNGTQENRDFLQSRYYTLATEFRDKPLEQKGYRQPSDIIPIVKKILSETSVPKLEGK